MEWGFKYARGPTRSVPSPGEIKEERILRGLGSLQKAAARPSQSKAKGDEDAVLNMADVCALPLVSGK